LRVLSQHQQLIRADFEQPHGIDEQVELIKFCQQELKQAGLLVLSDYGKGVLADARPYIQAAQASGVPVLVDPKKDDFENYRGSWLITPNYREFEAVVGVCHGDAEIEHKARDLISRYQLGGLLITRGEQGMDLILGDEPLLHFPAHAREVYDVTGAGDTVIAAVASGVAAGMSPRDAVFVACKAAAIVVGRLGTASVTPEDLAALDRGETTKS
jgi:D-beta-D-heptose 7-phosphate kinase/D-beta-D-heptose 1-phosphate adenosyltransferase